MGWPSAAARHDQFRVFRFPRDFRFHSPAADPNDEIATSDCKCQISGLRLRCRDAQGASAELQKSCQASDIHAKMGRTHANSALCLAATCQDVQKTSQLHEPVEMENSEKETSKLPHSPEMRISAGSDSFPAEFLRGRGGGKQARIVSWHLTNSRSRFQHCLNRRERSVF